MPSDNEIVPIVEVMPVEDNTGFGSEILEIEREQIRKTLRKSYKDILKQALINAYKQKGKHIIEHMVERAYVEDGVLIALMKKIVPDKANVEVNFSLTYEAVQEARKRAGLVIAGPEVKKEDDGQSITT